MAKKKESQPEEIVRDCLVVYYDGYGKEHQGFDPDNRLWVFTEAEAVRLSKKKVKEGATKASVWKPQPTPEKLYEFERGRDGHCQQTYPGRQY